jgi:hypothetical protein
MKASIHIQGEIFSVDTIKRAFSGLNAQFKQKRVQGVQSLYRADFDTIKQAHEAMREAHRCLKNEDSPSYVWIVRNGRIEELHYDEAKAVIKRNEVYRGF